MAQTIGLSASAAQASIDRLLLVVAIAVLVSSLQGYAVSLDGLRHQVDPTGNAA